MDSFINITIIVVIVLVVGLVLLEPVLNKSKSRSKQKYLDQLDKLFKDLKDKKIATSLAIIQADTLLDKALKSKYGLEGTLGEKLKTLQTKFTSELYNKIWEFHKLRNTIVHENVQIDMIQATEALNVFKKAIESL